MSTTLRSFNELYESRSLASHQEYIRGTVIGIYLLKDGSYRILLEDDSHSGPNKSLVTFSPFDSFSDKQRLFVSFSPEIANLLFVPSRHDKILISGPFALENCMITHQDDMHPHLSIGHAGLIPVSLRIIFSSKNLTESIHLQLVSSSTGSKLLNPVPRTIKVSADASANPLLSFNESFPAASSAVPKIHLYPQLITLSPNTIVDLLGVIVEWSEPRSCQGKDLFMKILIADHSTESSSAPFLVNLFLSSTMDFPQFLQPGEIIRLHRIKIQGYKNELMGLSSKGFSFLVIPVDSTEPRASTSKHASTTPLSDEDMHRISSLRSWWTRLFNRVESKPNWLPIAFQSHHQSDESPMAPPIGTANNHAFPFVPNFKKLKEVRDIRAGIFFDLVAEAEETESQNADVMFSVILTDYTENFRLRYTLSMIMFARCIAIEEDRDTVTSTQDKLICTFWDEHVPVARSELSIGRIIYLRNLHARACSSASETEDIIAVMHGYGKIASNSIIPIDHPADVSFCHALLQRREESGAIRELAIEPPSITRFEHAEIPVSSLDQILLFPSVPAVYRSRVKMVGFFPSNVAELTRTYCFYCKKSSRLEFCTQCHQKLTWIFLFGTIIQHPNIVACRLPLLCYGEDAERLFGKPGDFSHNTEERLEFTKRLLSLLSEVDGSGGPLLDIGIRVYRKDSISSSDPTAIRYALLQTQMTTSHAS